MIKTIFFKLKYYQLYITCKLYFITELWLYSLLNFKSVTPYY